MKQITITISKLHDDNRLTEAVLIVLNSKANYVIFDDNGQVSASASITHEEAADIVKTAVLLFRKHGPSFNVLDTIDPVKDDGPDGSDLARDID